MSEAEGQSRGPSAQTADPAGGPRRAVLRNTRLAWAAALLVQGLNLAYELSIGAAAAVAWPLRPPVLALIVLLVAVVFAHSARLQSYKRGWRGGAVAAAAYFRGNALAFAALTLAACLLLGAAPTTGVDRGVVRALALAATLATALNWPHGKPMRPS